MELNVIAYARNGHTDKFGIPRQRRDESPIVTRIVFEPEYSVPEALRGIEGFSHLWLIWGFSETSRSRDVDTSKEVSWSPTVRPPRLGGNKRMGVFATRSPFRPNPLGLSSVRLLYVKGVQTPSGRPFTDRVQTGKQTIELIVTGADLLDGTPIYDIKPYLSFSDCHEDALNGFAEETKDYRLNVEGLTADMEDSVKADIEYILSQDPRPAYQDDPEREYKMDYAGWRITFTVKVPNVFVKKIEKTTK